MTHGEQINTRLLERFWGRSEARREPQTWHLPLLEAHPGLDWRSIPTHPPEARNAPPWEVGAGWRHPVERMLHGAVEPHTVAAPNPEEPGRPLWVVDGWRGAVLMHVLWPPGNPRGEVIPHVFRLAVMRTPEEAMRNTLETLEHIAAEWELERDEAGVGGLPLFGGGR